MFKHICSKNASVCQTDANSNAYSLENMASMKRRTIQFLTMAKWEKLSVVTLIKYQSMMSTWMTFGHSDDRRVKN